MLAVRSLVLVALISVWQYVKCQDTEFPINSPFVSVPTFSRSLGDSRVISSDEMYQPNLYDRMNYENFGIGKTNDYTNFNSNMNVNSNHNLRGPISWHQSKSMSRSMKRRLKPRRTRNFISKKVRNLTPNVKSLLQFIDPEFHAALDLDMNLPFSKGSPVHLFGRRNAINNHDDKDSDDEFTCYSAIKNILLNISIMKDTIQDLENQLIKCLENSQQSVF